MATSSRIAHRPTHDLATSVLVTTSQITCAPWCWDHRTDETTPEGGYCTGAPRDIFFSRLFLSNKHIPGEGQLQRIYVERAPVWADEDPADGDDVLAGSMSLLAARRTARALHELVDEALAAQR